MSMIKYDNQTRSFALKNIRPKLTGTNQMADALAEAKVRSINFHQKQRVDRDVEMKKIQAKRDYINSTEVKKDVEKIADAQAEAMFKAQTGMTMDEFREQKRKREADRKRSKIKTLRKEVQTKKINERKSKKTQVPKGNIPETETLNNSTIPNNTTSTKTGDINKVNLSRKADLASMGIGAGVGAGVGAASTIGLKKRLLKKGYTEKEADRKVKKAIALRTGIGALGGAALGIGARSLYKHNLKSKK